LPSGYGRTENINQLERLQKILRAKENPAYFLSDPYFIGDLVPYPKQAEIFCDFYNGRYKELDMVAGTGGGKSALGGMFLARETFDVLVRVDPARDYNLQSHSLITIYAIAKSIDQAADTIFAEVVNRMQAPFFQDFQPRVREYDITFRKHPDIQIEAGGAVSAGSLMGRNVKAIGMDEITSWDETQSQRGAWNVYNRLRKSTNRFGFHGHVFVISMCWHMNDIIMTLVRQKDPNSLTKSYTTWEMNPLKPFESPEMQAELNKDPISFWRDYGVQPHSSIESYYPEISAVKMNDERINLLEHAQEGRFFPSEKTYVLSADPSIDNCNFGLALMTIENDKIVADGLLRLVPQGKKELDPVEVKKLLLSILKNYHVAYFLTDQWSYNEAIYDIKLHGVEVLFKPLRKEEHDSVKNAFYENSLELCNFPEILDEFGSLLVLDSRRIGVVRKGRIDTVDALTRGFWGVKTYLAQHNAGLALVEVI